VQTNDPFATGIVYIPIGLAYVAASLRRAGLPITVIDAFSEAPRQVRKAGERAIFVYANQLINQAAVAEIIRGAKQAFPTTPVDVLENTQAVSAYALRPVAKTLYDAGLASWPARARSKRSSS
jgi:anaerobic magnesium-protoporphyrin IX monomethyl ester cyclase